MQRAYQRAAELDRYSQLQGDVLNLTGQARSYYARANVALTDGKKQQSNDLARISERLTQAALHLERAQHGALPVSRVVGWSRPATTVAKAPANGEEASEADLTRRLQESKAVATSSEGATWHQTAQKMADEARADWKAQRFEASRERAHAAMMLLDAAELQGQLQA